MIYDKIDNQEIYAGIAEDIRLGLEWLRDVNPDIEKGLYELSPQIKAIVSEYTTKEMNENGYEAHRDYIDIQYLLRGREKICCLPLEYLKQTKVYTKEIDAAFYEESDTHPQEMIIGNGYFAILYPQDGHMPCLCLNEPMIVKKVVIKVQA
jgi:YhcH/YjgK/YiaL family protein